MSTSDLPTLPGDEDQDKRPLPLIVAQKWGFRLSHIHLNDEIFYAVQD